jgi:hypothetical protein
LAEHNAQQVESTLNALTPDDRKAEQASADHHDHPPSPPEANPKWLVTGR